MSDVKIKAAGGRYSWDLFYQNGDGLKEHLQLNVETFDEWVEERGKSLEKLIDEGAEPDASFGRGGGRGAASAPAPAPVPFTGAGQVAPPFASQSTTCVQCGAQLMGFVDRTGKEMTAQALAASRVKNYGNVYCNKCYKDKPKIGGGYR